MRCWGAPCISVNVELSKSENVQIVVVVHVCVRYHQLVFHICSVIVRVCCMASPMQVVLSFSRIHSSGHVLQSSVIAKSSPCLTLQLNGVGWQHPIAGKE